MDQKPFSAWHAVGNDFSLTLPMLVPIFAWLIYLLPHLLMGGSAFFFYLAVAATVVGPLLLWWKLRGIRKVFQNGQVVMGKIRSAKFIKDRGRITYRYMFGGEERIGTITVHVTERTQSYQKDQDVEIVVNPEKPEQSYLRGLYT